ncbi:hypothetical protein ACH4XT_15755 [Streptomyces avidinii]|uniref:hypothetical protein n=1 Tax=Streptomyces avidinii TaxID=1895 RepID=UPI0037AE9989
MRCLLHAVAPPLGPSEMMHHRPGAFLAVATGTAEPPARAHRPDRVPSVLGRAADAFVACHPANSPRQYGR